MVVQLSRVKRAKAKGVVYCAARDYVRKTHGDDALDACLAELPHAQRLEAESAVPIGWYPLDLVVDFLGSVDKVCGTGDGAECAAIGRFSADWALNMFHRMFLRFKSPHWMLEKAPKMWTTYYDSGLWTVLPHTERTMGCQLREFGTANPVMCHRLMGWLQRAGELTGAPDVVVEHPKCRSRGDDCCEFHGSW